MSFRSGDKVYHKKYGYGIFQYYGMEDNKAVVEFKNGKLMILPVDELKGV